MTARVASVNISREKGTTKSAVDRAVISGLGLEGDAHAGNTHRQVSLLGLEQIERFSKEVGRKFKPGDFAENITTSGLDFDKLALRDYLRIGEANVEITQFGKKCHGDGCAIFRESGKCVMPKEGVFARVLKGGNVKTGDSIEHFPCPLRVLVITLSDRASRGEYADKSGPRLRDILTAHFAESDFNANVTLTLLPDDPTMLRDQLRTAVGNGVDALFTTGGTGLGERDITPDVVRPLLDKEIPGIMESIRLKSAEKKPSALLSRSIAGMIGRMLVFALPGSVKAVEEYMAEIQKVLDHCLLTVSGIDAHG